MLKLRNLRSIYLIVLVLLAVLPINGSNAGINHIYIISLRLDYLLHALVSLPLLFLLCNTSSAKFIFLIPSALLFAAVLEAIQYLLPWRSFNINDLLANLLGVVLGLFLLLPGVNKGFLSLIHRGES